MFYFTGIPPDKNTIGAETGGTKTPEAARDVPPPVFPRSHNKECPTSAPPPGQETAASNNSRSRERLPPPLVLPVTAQSLRSVNCRRNRPAMQHLSLIRRNNTIKSIPTLAHFQSPGAEISAKTLRTTPETEKLMRSVCGTGRWSTREASRGRAPRTREA